MNERIRELAEQAGGEFYEGFAGSTNFVKFAEDDFEKFAELIVKECMYVGRLSQINNGLVDSDIKDHFYGVEE